MNKQEYILELIQKGHSDEEIELLVKDKFPEEEIIPFMPAAPAASTNVTPQAYFDRLVAATIKLEAKKLSKANIAHKKGQITIFNVEKVAPSKFADTTLFDKVVLPIKYITETKTKTFQSAGNIGIDGWTPTKILNVVFGYTGFSKGTYERYDSDTRVNLLGNTAITKYLDLSIGNNSTSIGGNDANANVCTYIIEYQRQVALSQNVEYKYIAKKDITFAEMGEN